MKINTLSEWVDSQGKKMVSKSTASNMTATSTTSSTASNKDRIKALIDYHISQLPNYGHVTHYEIKNLINDDSRYYLHYYEEQEQAKGHTLRLDIIISVFLGEKKESWSISVFYDEKLRKHYSDDHGGIMGVLACIEREKIFLLPTKGSKEYQTIFNESLSFADDFRLYEDLWN